HHDADVLCDEPRSLALEHPASGARRRAVPLHGRPVLRRQRAEDSLRRLGPPGHRAPRVPADDHLATGPRGARPAHAGEDGAEDGLAACRANSLDTRIEGTTFFLGRETLVAAERPGMAEWRAKLFAFMSRNALRATAFFKIPANQVFEVGAQVEL